MGKAFIQRIFTYEKRLADGGTRTHTEISLKRILSPLRLPFRHIGGSAQFSRKLFRRTGIYPALAAGGQRKSKRRAFLYDTLLSTWVDTAFADPWTCKSQQYQVIRTADANKSPAAKPAIFMQRRCPRKLRASLDPQKVIDPLGLPSSSSPLEAGFGEVDIALDVAENFVVNRLVIAQGDDGFAFRVQGFAG
jgi:hypothetical protein